MYRTHRKQTYMNTYHTAQRRPPTEKSDVYRRSTRRAHIWRREKERDFELRVVVRGCVRSWRKRMRQEPVRRSRYHFFYKIVSVLLNEIEQHASEKERGKTHRKNHVVMASRQRAMKELGRVTFFLTPHPVVAHPGSPLGLPKEGFPRDKDSFKYEM